MLFGESFEEEPITIDARLDPAHAGLSGTLSCLAERTHLAGRSEIRSWRPLRTGRAEGRLETSTLRAAAGGTARRSSSWPATAKARSASRTGASTDGA